MAKTQTLYLTGKGSWFQHLVEPDEYMGIRKWKFNFYPDPASMEKLKALGTKKKFKEDKDGTFMVIDRPVEKPWTPKDGEAPEFDPPTLLDAESKPWPEDKIIGNGSVVTIKVEVYPWQFQPRDRKGNPSGNLQTGKATRLNTVRIDEWVEYIAPDNAAPKSSNTNTNTSVDADIPF